MQILSKILFPLLAINVAACSKIAPGEVGIRVNTLGMERGVEDIPLDVGWYWTGLTQTLYTYPVFSQPYLWTASPHEGNPNDESMTFQDAEGTQCNADVGIQYTILKAKVPQLFQKYRQNVHTITHVVLRNSVRDALIRVSSTYSTSEIYGSKKSEIITKAQHIVQEEFDPVGIHVDKLYWVSEIRIPTAIKESLNRKIQANQIAEQKQNEVAAVKADAQKAVEEAEGKKQASIKEAEGIAARNKLIKESLSPEVVQYEMATRWNGVMPMFSTGSSGAPSLMVNPADLMQKK